MCIFTSPLPRLASSPFLSQALIPTKHLPLGICFQRTQPVPESNYRLTASLNLACTTVWMTEQFTTMRIIYSWENKLSVWISWACGVDAKSLCDWRRRLLDVQIGMWRQLATWFRTSSEGLEPEIKAWTSSVLGPETWSQESPELLENILEVPQVSWHI